MLDTIHVVITISLSTIFFIIFLVLRLRSRVASGQTSQPPASNMMQLSWDNELAAVAQAHADQCKFK